MYRPFLHGNGEFTIDMAKRVTQWEHLCMQDELIPDSYAENVAA